MTKEKEVLIHVRPMKFPLSVYVGDTENLRTPLDQMYCSEFDLWKVPSWNSSVILKNDRICMNPKDYQLLLKNMTAYVQEVNAGSTMEETAEAIVTIMKALAPMVSTSVPVGSIGYESGVLTVSDTWFPERNQIM